MQMPLKVLFVEDRLYDVELALYELSKAGYDVTYEVVETESKYQEKLEEEWDVIISDDSMPRFSAQAALDCLKESGKDIPFIIVSGKISEEFAVECMRNGASDYLIKDRLTRLGPAVAHAMEQHRLRREFRKKQEEREQLLARERQARSEAEDARRKISFLDEVTRTLNRSLNYKETLAQLADFIVLRMADWCIIHLFGVDGNLNCVASAHRKWEKTAKLNEVPDKVFLNLQPEWSQLSFSDTRRAAIFNNVNMELLLGAELDKHRSVLTEIGMPQSVMLVPLYSRGRLLGVLNFVWAAPNKKYEIDDLTLAEDMASRAALYVDNALLYEESQRLHRLKDEFLATLQHELRTPLTSIIGWVNLLRDESFDAVDLDEALEIIYRNAMAQNAIISDIVDVSRITSGQLSFEPKVVEFKSALLNAIEAVRLSAKAKSIDINLDLCSKEYSVLGDASRLQQICWNLLANAVKFTPAHGKINIKLQKTGSLLKLTVADTGMGISKEFLPRIFERFQQEDSSLSRRFGGLGLGLAIVSHIVEMHGGTIAAMSEGKGYGAEFSISLPLLKDSRAGLANQQYSASAFDESDMTLNILNNIKALVIEDDSNMRILMKKFLEKAGATVEQASTAIEGFNIWSKSKPNIILCDLAMPGEDGFSLMRRLRSAERKLGTHTPALAISAYDSQEDYQHSLEVGFDMHMAKPFKTEDLILAIKNLTTGPLSDYKQ